jgi:hypothetical protein
VCFWAALSKSQALSLILYVSQQLSIDRHSEKSASPYVGSNELRINFSVIPVFTRENNSICNSKRNLTPEHHNTRQVSYRDRDRAVQGAVWVHMREINLEVLVRGSKIPAACTLQEQ